MSTKQELKLFDSNCMLGRSIGSQGGSLDNLAMLRSYMSRYHISKVLVYSSIAKYYSPKEGNALLVEETKGQPDIYQMWVALPNHTGEFWEPEELRKRICAERIGAIRLCPKKHGYSTTDWCCGELLQVLNELQIPVFLDYEVQHWSDPLPWDEFYRLCRTYPKIPFVLTRIGCGSNRNLFALLEKCENLYFEISYFAANRWLEAVTKRFGASRMLFGTCAPIYSPGCPIGLLYYSAISDEDKQKIAGENLERLIGGINYGA